MIFTFRANKHQVEEAAIKNRAEGRKEGREEGIEEGEARRDAVWQEWLDQVRDLLPEDAPPPPGLGNGAGNGHKEK